MLPMLQRRRMLAAIGGAAIVPLAMTHAKA
jgi:hypothetical protein